VTTPELPSTLGSYQVVRLIADLPTGRALLGTDTTGRAVVLTLVHPAVAAGAGFRERFTAQARAAAAAPLWFVAAVVDVAAAADPPWRAEVHVAGATLQQFVDDRGPLGHAGTAALAERLAAGLAAVHAGGSAHGDLTPSAIVLAEDGPRLVGFGLVAAAGPGYGTPGYEPPEASTAGYGAPVGGGGVSAASGWPDGGGAGPGGGGLADGRLGSGDAGLGDGGQARWADGRLGSGDAGLGDGGQADGRLGGGGMGPGGGGVSAAGDVFALGAVLAFAATGRPAFGGGPAAEVRRRAAEDAPDLGDLAEPIRSTVLACLHKDPSRPRRRSAACWPRPRTPRPRGCAADGRRAPSSAYRPRTPARSGRPAGPPVDGSSPCSPSQRSCWSARSSR
jgi:serine/threonine protein kinase